MQRLSVNAKRAFLNTLVVALGLAAASRARADGGKPSLVYLTVGVSRYPEEEHCLNYAAKDARDIAGLLRRQAGGQFAGVTGETLTDAQATGRGIQGALG